MSKYAHAGFKIFSDVAAGLACGHIEHAHMYNVKYAAREARPKP